MSDGEPSWTYLCHMPGLVMGEAELPFADGTLGRMTYDEWYGLDHTTWQPVDYNDCSPVFYRVTARGERNRYTGPGSGVVSGFSARSNRAYRALALTVGWPLLPHPALSCRYILEEGSSRCENFLIGPCGRDWILTGQFRHPRHLLSDEALAASDGIFKLLTRADERLPGTFVEAGLRALELAALPDHSERLDSARFEIAFLGCVAAMERILVPPTGSEGQGSITRTFSRNAGALLGRNFDEIDAWADQFRQVYSLRSDLMHGRIRLDPDEDRAKVLGFGCGAFLLILREALIILVEAPLGFDIPAFLSQVSSSRAEFEKALR
jgi:hypothetical protein